METCRLRRFFSAWIDNILCGILGFIILFVAGKELGKGSWAALGRLAKHRDFDSAMAAPGIVALAFICILAYNFLEVLFAASPGKLILGIKIATLDGRCSSTARLLSRWLIKNLGTVLFVVALALGARSVATAANYIDFGLRLGVILIFLPASQTLWDLLAGTCVYRSGDVYGGGELRIAADRTQESGRALGFGIDRANRKDPNDLFKSRW